MDIKIQRGYSRTVEVKKPDGTSIWLKHDAMVEAILPSEDANVQAAFNEMRQTCMTEVGNSIIEERRAIAAAFAPKPANAPVNDEPFESGTPTSTLLKNLPKL